MTTDEVTENVTGKLGEMNNLAQVDDNCKEKHDFEYGSIAAPDENIQWYWSGIVLSLKLLLPLFFVKMVYFKTCIYTNQPQSLLHFFTSLAALTAKFILHLPLAGNVQKLEMDVQRFSRLLLGYENKCEWLIVKLVDKVKESANYVNKAILLTESRVNAATKYWVRVQCFIGLDLQPIYMHKNSYTKDYLDVLLLLVLTANVATSNKVINNALKLNW
jgi:hypothetical protein